MDVNELQNLASSLAHQVATAFQKVPGSSVVLRYVRSSYQNDPIRSAFELILVLIFVRYLLSPAYRTHNKNFVSLTEDEVDELVNEWQPEPLVAPMTVAEERELVKLPVIDGATGPTCKLTNGATVVNLASFNFYNLNSNDAIKQRTIQTLRKYGVGPCGPPQFYGTQDVHVTTEADIARFIGTEKCIVYAQTLSTISSVIPAFCKRGDVIIADKAANYSIRRGLEISRSVIRWFDHNDMDDLEQLMKRLAAEQAAKKKLTRRFIVSEGLFETCGDSPDLQRLVELKEKYKFRIILDETWSFGVLGPKGRGLTEAQGVDPTKIDMIIGSLAGPLCAGGGFCAGPHDVVEHQRISSASYCFSAALPAMTAVAAGESLKFIMQHPEKLRACRENALVLRQSILNASGTADWVVCTSSLENPILLFVLRPDKVRAHHISRPVQDELMQECVETCLDHGVLITRLKTARYVDVMRPPGATLGGVSGSGGGGRIGNAVGKGNEKAIVNSEEDDGPWCVQPALRVCSMTGISKEALQSVGRMIGEVVVQVMERHVGADN